MNLVISPFGHLVIFAVLLSTSRSVGAQDAAAFNDVMRRAHAYVVVYEDHELSSVIAREHYYQEWLDVDGRRKADRTLLSDYVLFQLPPDEDWFALRDVNEVDGVPVGDRAARLKALFDGPREQVGERAMEIAKESARFNLGDLPRTVNVPTFALRLLRPSNRQRLVFTKGGEEQVEGATTWVITYRETRRPTFSATIDGRDVPAHGRFWIEPETGVVVRSEMILGGTRQLPARATISVTYALESSVGFRLPVEMRERYDDPRHKKSDVILGVATYSDFRPFDTRRIVRGSSDETRPAPKR